MIDHEKPETPPSSFNIWITEALAIGIGAVATVATFVEPREPFVALGAAASGVTLVDFGSIFFRLSRLDHHVRGNSDI
jgi:hypothetical protein